MKRVNNVKIQRKGQFKQTIRNTVIRIFTADFVIKNAAAFFAYK
jgi:hypothetical protein